MEREQGKVSHEVAAAGRDWVRIKENSCKNTDFLKSWYEINFQRDF